MNKNHGIIIHPEDFEDLLTMSAEEAGHIIQNVIKTFNGDDVVPFADRYLTRVSNDMCGRVIRDKELSERQRNRALGNQNAKKTPQKRQENAEKTPNNCPNTKTNTKTNTNNKRPYGECANVFLTDEEYKKIKDEGYAGLIEELSLYIESKGVKYKSHYATIRQWAKRRKQEQAEKKVGNFPSPYAGENSTNAFNRFSQRDIDFSDLEKGLIKN